MYIARRTSSSLVTRGLTHTTYSTERRHETVRTSCIIFSPSMIPGNISYPMTYRTQKKNCYNLKHDTAAGHQRQLLLLAAASSSNRDCVSRDTRRPTFVCMHAGPDTYLVYREVPKFNFPTSQSKNRTTIRTITR